VQEIAKNFVPCADEVWWLQNRAGPECDYFRAIAEKGHYGGNGKGTTRQGIYAAAPGGEFLASCNTNDPDAMIAMLTKALAKWRELPKEKRLRDAPLDDKGRTRMESQFPADGLALRAWSRDLPRAEKARGYFAHAWNTDTCWFTADEARSFLPTEPTAGATHDVPAALVRRLSRCHLLDNVRGQTMAYDDKNITAASLKVDVVSVDGDTVTLKLSGESKAAAKGRWPVKGFDDADKPSEQERSMELALLGKAVFDLAKKRFTAFELVAAGTRRGGTQYNGRSDDLAPQPIGFAFTLATDSPSDRVAPAFVWAYGWRR
jgi:hypothetical protein